MTLMIGSSALVMHMPGVRDPKDCDLFSSDRNQSGDVFWHPLFIEWDRSWDKFEVASLDELYTIKLSHSYWELRNGSWPKHMYDMVMMRRAGAQPIDWLHDLLYRVWEDRYGKKRVQFNQTSMDFFDDNVTRVYDHDSLHRSMTYGDRPMYESVLKDDQVTMNMSAVKALSFEDCVRLFREEIYVTALERLVIPNGYDYHAKMAYTWALRRVITSLTKGWSARFIAHNYDVFRKPDIDYVARHRSNADKLIRLEAVRG